MGCAASSTLGIQAEAVDKKPDSNGQEGNECQVSSRADAKLREIDGHDNITSTKPASGATDVDEEVRAENLAAQNTTVRSSDDKGGELGSIPSAKPPVETTEETSDGQNSRTDDASNHGQKSIPHNDAEEHLQPLESNASNRGVAIGWFLEDFLPKLEGDLTFEGGLKEQTTKEVVLNRVMPDTVDKRCCYVQLPGVRTSKPQYFVSHTWHRPFRELRTCLQQRFAGVDPSTVVWIDIFAFNQHMTFEEMKADLMTLESTVINTDATLVVLDAEGVCFTRAWCLKEHHTAIMAGGDGPVGRLEILPYCLEVGNARKVARMMHDIDINNATAFKPEDKEVILGDIQRSGGTAEFNADLKKALAIGMERIAQALPEGSLRRAAMEGTAGNVLRMSGQLDRALPFLEQALATVLVLLPPGSVGLSEAQNNLGLLMEDMGKYRRGKTLLTEALEGLSAKHGTRHASSAAAMDNLAKICDKLGERTKAEPLYVGALEARRAVFGDMHAETARSLNNLGRFHSNGEGPESRARAEELLKESIRVYAETEGERSTEYAAALNNLGALRCKEEAWEEALEALEKAREIQVVALGPRHQDTLAVKSNLALLADNRGDSAAAEKMYRDVVAALEEEVGRDHAATATAMHNLGLHYEQCGQLGNARAMLESSLEARSAALGDNHADTGASMHSVGMLCHDVGDFPAAEQFFTRAVDSRNVSHGPDHPVTAQSVESLALVARSQGRLLLAEELYTKALEAKTAALGPVDRSTACSEHGLAVVLRMVPGRLDEAQAHCKAALDARLSALGEMHRETAESLDLMGMILKTAGDAAAAEAFYTRALAARREVCGKHPDTAASLNNLAMLQAGQGLLAPAEENLQAALAMWQETLGEQHPMTAAALHNLGDLNLKQGKAAGAKLLYKAALKVRSSLLPAGHPELLATQRSLAGVLKARGDLKAAADLFRIVWESMVATTGGEASPDAMTALVEFAGASIQSGGHEEVLLLLESALGRLEEAEKSEPPHPGRTMLTAAVACCLADGCVKSEDYKRAEALYLKSRALRSSLLGDVHPETVAVTSLMVRMYKAQGNAVEAQRHCLSTLEIWRQLTGGQPHPAVAATMSDLAEINLMLGDRSAAEPLLTEALQIWEATVGQDHPKAIQAQKALEDFMKVDGGN